MAIWDRYLSWLSAFGDFLRNETGSMSLELLVVLPLFVTVLVASLAFWDGYRTKSQTAKIAYTASDILSRYDVIDDASMGEVVAMIEKMLDPGLDHRSVRVSSICFADDRYTVLWSHATNSSDAATVKPLTDAEIPPDFLPLLEEQESVILTEVHARWRPMFDYIGLTEQFWRNTLVTRPRFKEIVPHKQLNESTICPVETDNNV